MNDETTTRLETLRGKSKTLRGAYIAYLSAALFLGLAVESVTHEQLLNPEIGLFGLGVLQASCFFTAAPGILLLLQLYFLARAVQYAGELATQSKARFEAEPVKNWPKHLSGKFSGILVLVPTFSCWSLVYFSHSLGFSALAKTERFSHLRYVRAREFWGATFFTAAAAATTLELEGLFFLMFVSLWTALFERFFPPKRPENADTVLWTVVELNEVSVLLVALIMQKGFSMMTSEGVWL